MSISVLLDTSPTILLGAASASVLQGITLSLLIVPVLFTAQLIIMLTTKQNIVNLSATVQTICIVTIPLGHALGNVQLFLIFMLTTSQSYALTLAREECMQTQALEAVCRP